MDIRKLIKVDNYDILFAFRTLKSILSIFVESFLILYFLTLSDNNIIPLGIYRIVSMFVVFVTIYLLRNVSKARDRIYLLRTAIFLDLIYFLVIIFLKEKIVDYIYLVGFFYGLEEGFYYSVFSMFESNGVKNKERTRFMGNFTIVKSILSIIFPIIFGSLIAATSFIKAIFVVLIIVCIRMILSFLFKDENFSKTEKTNIKEYLNVVKKDNNIRRIYAINFFNGLTYSKGAFQSIITIYIIKVFSDSFSLGIFTSIFSLISCLIGYLFVKCIKKKSYSNIIRVSMSLTIISLLIMVFKCNFYTIVLFNFFQTISRELLDLINENSRSNISNLASVRKEYKVEYFLGVEFMLFLGRMISQSLFILMAFVDVIFIIPMFVFFLLMLMVNSIELQVNTK